LFALLATGVLAAPPNQAGNLEDLPEGVRVETVASNLHLPVSMAFDPSGRLFYTEKDGNVRLLEGTTVRERPVINFSVNTGGERGLLGIAIDPKFNQNRYIYVYYTCDPGPGCDSLENRVVRFTERDGVGSDPQVIFRSRQTAGNHVGGNIHFGPDGKLYVTIGDNANAANSQNLDATQGKLHRLNPDGSVPADNPRIGGQVRSVYAYGLRNSFDFAFSPLNPDFLVASENGPGCDDEMNRIVPGYNYGWRANYPCDDPNPNPDFNTIRPLWFLGDDGCCVAPTGIEVYAGYQIPQWRGHIFMAGYNNGAMYHMTPNADGTALTSVTRLRNVTANMDIANGPDGALWYVQGGGYQSGSIRRLVGPGQPPTPATPAATPPPSSPSIPGNGARTFPETGKTVTGIFLDYWANNGGLAQQGYPISGLLNETSDLNGKPYVMQYFERAVFEYHPENQPPYSVLLSQLGTFRYHQKYPDGAPNQRPNSTPGSITFPETGKTLGGRFLQYWQDNGGLAQQGFPISDEFTEVSDLDAKPYTVQYFERAVFELHPENAPPHDVLLSQLGTFRYRDKYPAP
jgi:glucose/arabinose dehydrogenase